MVLEYYKKAKVLRLFLSRKNPCRQLLIKSISDFTEFAIIEYNPNVNEVMADYCKNYPVSHNELVFRIGNIIEYAESTM